ncbi:hypothetical protein ACHAXT_012842 [Thalassiosira profunda]
MSLSRELSVGSSPGGSPRKPPQSTPPRASKRYGQPSAFSPYGGIAAGGGQGRSVVDQLTLARRDANYQPSHGLEDPTGAFLLTPSLASSRGIVSYESGLTVPPGGNATAFALATTYEASAAPGNLPTTLRLRGASHPSINTTGLGATAPQYEAPASIYRVEPEEDVCCLDQKISAVGLSVPHTVSARNFGDGASTLYSSSDESSVDSFGFGDVSRAAMTYDGRHLQKQVSHTLVNTEKTLNLQREMAADQRQRHSAAAEQAQHRDANHNESMAMMTEGFGQMGAYFAEERARRKEKARIKADRAQEQLLSTRAAKVYTDSKGKLCESQKTLSKKK